MSIATPGPQAAALAAERVVRERRRAQWNAVGPFVLGATGVFGFVLAWQLFSDFGPVNKEHLPPPTVVLPVFAQNFTFIEFWVTIGQTMWAWLLGLTISIASGLAVGLIIGSNGFLRKITHSTIEFLRPVPAVGLIPIAALIFGPRIGSELFIIIYGCFWIILIQVLYGVGDVDSVAKDTVRTMRLGFVYRVRFLVMPTLLPYLTTGIRLAATVALILAISSELIIGTPGLGRSVGQAQLNDNPPAMLALILTAGVLGIVVNMVFRFLERRLLFWHASVRSEVAV